VNDLALYQPTERLKPLISYLGVGNDPALETQLIAKSRQTHVLQFAPNDAGSRFSDAKAIERRRLTKKREYYWLIGPHHDLAGTIWFGPKTFELDLDLPEHPTDTFAIRIYENYLGKGFAVPFLEQSLALETSRRKAAGESALSLWLEANTDNPAALSSYKKIGFHSVHSTAARVTMVLPSSQLKDIVSRYQLSKVGESS